MMTSGHELSCCILGFFNPLKFLRYFVRSDWISCPNSSGTNSFAACKWILASQCRGFGTSKYIHNAISFRWPWLPVICFLGFPKDVNTKSMRSGPGLLHSVSPWSSIGIRYKTNALWPWPPALCFFLEF